MQQKIQRKKYKRKFKGLELRIKCIMKERAMIDKIKLDKS